MARLTVIADDLTGALDTGVQFANRCVSVRVAAVHGTAAVHEELFQADVAVIDAEVRHRSPAASLQDLFRARATRRCAAGRTPFISKQIPGCEAISARCSKQPWTPVARRLRTMHRRCPG